VNRGRLRLRVAPLPTSTSSTGPHLPGSCIREDINNLRSDDLRRETVQVQMDLHLERIETRLNLHDAE
jgi:hypothetical protein